MAGSPRPRRRVLPSAAFQGLPQRAPKDILNGYTWELYKLDDDPTQADDIAAKNPAKLAEMKEGLHGRGREVPGRCRSTTDRSSRFLKPSRARVAGAAQVRLSPARLSERAEGRRAELPRPGPTRCTAEVGVFPRAAPKGCSWTDGGQLRWHRLLSPQGQPGLRLRLRRRRAVPLGGRGRARARRARPRLRLPSTTGSAPGSADAATLRRCDGKAADSERRPDLLKFMFPEDETFDVGVDTRTPIDDRELPGCRSVSPARAQAG